MALLRDAHNRNQLWSLLISLLVHNRGAVDAVPRFTDNPGTKIPTFLGSVTEQQPVSPLNELLADLVRILWEPQEAGSLTVPADPRTPRGPSRRKPSDLPNDGSNPRPSQWHFVWALHGTKSYNLWFCG